ncbi:MAG TPA: hypothetical protein VMN36_17005 [Verrucomicrobiales bacterium]|nr:hypothetical protein [Verrucomicrobiales bacterium]
MLIVWALALSITSGTEVMPMSISKYNVLDDIIDMHMFADEETNSVVKVFQLAPGDPAFNPIGLVVLVGRGATSDYERKVWDTQIRLNTVTDVSLSGQTLTITGTFEVEYWPDDSKDPPKVREVPRKYSIEFKVRDGRIASELKVTDLSLPTETCG